MVGANRCRGNEHSRTCVGQMSMSGRLRALEHTGWERESQLPDQGLLWIIDYETEFLCLATYSYLWTFWLLTVLQYVIVYAKRNEDFKAWMVLSSECTCSTFCRHSTSKFHCWTRLNINEGWHTSIRCARTELASGNNQVKCTISSYHYWTRYD